eukprot:1714946-Prymnesium_polylepis.1
MAIALCPEVAARRRLEARRGAVLRGAAVALRQPEARLGRGRRRVLVVVQGGPASVLLEDRPAAAA